MDKCKQNKYSFQLLSKVIGYTLLFPLPLFISTIQYDMIKEFNVDSKAEYTA